ncbi:hypothetical protein [Nonomuraea sp. NPDC050643]|uniref:hypothetical protein n=1 Tax=Nonomuraea sp. NPDC050643 TaxID=3155660 RepID=UPI0033FEEE09
MGPHPGGPVVATAGYALLGWFAGRTAAPVENLPPPPTWPQPPTLRDLTCS